MSTSGQWIIWESWVSIGLRQDLTEFETFAKKAAAGGATHIDISVIPKTTWQKESADPLDPHPEWDSWTVWSRRAIGLFKLILPPELEAWLPKKEIDNNLQLMIGRCEILRKYGLRAVMETHEPMWLPEPAFQAHPEWRGAECQHPRLSRVPHFSPCLDNPEIIAMYRAAAEKLITALPELDYYNMLTNDSSGGICWAWTYPGKNGPEDCKDLPVIGKVVALFEALQGGAAAAGNDKFEVNIFNAGFWIDGQSEARKKLGKGQYIEGKDNEDKQKIVRVASNRWFASESYPVVGLPRVLSFFEELENAYGLDAHGINIGFGGEGFKEDLLIDALKAYQKNPSSGPCSQMALTRELAASRVGDEHAESLVTAWLELQRALDTTAWTYNGGQMLVTGPLMSRWTIMPLVPDVDRLTPDEQLYFQRGRAAKNEMESRDYCNLNCTDLPRDYYSISHIRVEYNAGIDHLTKAIETLEKLVSVVKPESVEELQDLSRRLQALRHLYRTTLNFFCYAHTLTKRERDDEDFLFRDEYYMGEGINRGSYELRMYARSEMDNVLKLAKLIESSPRQLLATAVDPDDEDGLHFGPDLVAHLRKKAKIMMKYWPLYDQLYPPVPEVKKLRIPALEQAGDIEEPKELQ